MRAIEIIIIAAVLAIDAFAVSIAYGINSVKCKPFKTLRVGLFFGGFQALMPIIGYYAWDILPFDMGAFDHWIAFILLLFIGVHIIKEAFESDHEDKKMRDLFNTRNLLIASIATSIDALAAGFSLSILNTGIALLSISTGIITMSLAMMGVYLGRKMGHILNNKMEVVSGIVLILIGIKILIENLIA